jgi:hypothetical protein
MKEYLLGFLVLLFIVGVLSTAWAQIKMNKTLNKKEDKYLINRDLGYLSSNLNEEGKKYRKSLFLSAIFTVSILVFIIVLFN